MIKRLKKEIRRLSFLSVGARALSRNKLRKKLCIFKCDGFGDFILATSTIRSLVNQFGEEHTTLVSFFTGADLAAAEFPKMERIVLPVTTGRPGYQKFLALVRQWWLLRSHSFECLVCLRHQRSDREDLALSWINTLRSFGVPREKSGGSCPALFVYQFSEPVTTLATAPHRGILCEELKRHGAVLTATFQRAALIEEFLPMVTSVKPRCENFAVVAAFASGVATTLKNLTPFLLEETLFWLHKRGIESIYLCGSTAQKEVLEEQSRSLARAGVKTEVLTTNRFSEFAEVLAAARIVYAADTGAAHLAIALDKPSVILIGGGHYGQFGPWTKSARQVWLTHHVPCFQCNWICCQPEPYCVTKVTPSMVIDAFHQVLAVDESSER